MDRGAPEPLAWPGSPHPTLGSLRTQRTEGPCHSCSWQQASGLERRVSPGRDPQVPLPDMLFLLALTGAWSHSTFTPAVGSLAL